MEEVAQGTTIGFKRIMKIAQVRVEQVRINIVASRACPIISNIEKY